MITTDEELMDRKSVQLDKIKLLQDGYEEAYQNTEEHKKTH